jgi:hypothetical protein
MLVSSRIKNLSPYVPGEQPKDRVYIKLNANENPYPPSKNVAKSLIKFIKQHPEKMGLYPDPDSVKLNEAIAKMLNQSGGVLCNAKVEGKKVSPAENDKIPFTVTSDPRLFCISLLWLRSDFPFRGAEGFVLGRSLLAGGSDSVVSAPAESLGGGSCGNRSCGGGGSD